MSTAAIITIIWILSGIVVIAIGRARGVRFGLPMDFALAFLGPFAILIAFFAKGKRVSRNQKP